MKELISVIIPVYNAEKYLRTAMDSVLAQTWQNMEIILINDGSTDHSESICREYVQKDDRVSLISQKNQGVSAARNRGMEHARGVYIYFADSDDTMENTILEKLYSHMCSSQAECSICGFCEIEEGKIRYTTSGDTLQMNQNQAIDRLLEQAYFRGYLWNKLFQKKIIEENHIRFDPKIHMWEDVLFDLLYFLHCKSVVYFPEPLYHYRQHPESQVGTKQYSSRNASVMRANRKILSLIPEKCQDAKKQASVRMMENALILLKRIADSENWRDYGQRRKEYRAIILKYYWKYRGGLSRSDHAASILVIISTRLFLTVYKMCNRSK